MVSSALKTPRFPSLSFRGKIYPGAAASRQTFDVILVSGDAYVDHPAFPTAVVCRILENLGLSVAIIAQPDWKTDADFQVWGEPKRFFAVVPGAMDSMVANFTATRMPRSKDRLSPGGQPGLRPKRAAQVYVQKIKQLFKKVPVVLGGVEASLRRFVHYDFWEDGLRDPILFDAPADIIVYGMAEAVLPKVVRWLENPVDMPQIAQTCIRVKHDSWQEKIKAEVLVLPGVAECRNSKAAFMEMSVLIDRLIRPGGPVLVQTHAKGDIISFPPDQADLRHEPELMARLQFNRRTHPVYEQPVPALEPVQFSIQSHRGCVGACSFCALSLHQGRFIRSRRQSDIVAEAQSFLHHPDFKGVIPDIGGPAVNMYGWSCKTSGCSRKICTEVELCANMVGGLGALAELLQAVAAIPGIRHVFVGSGLRFDLIKSEEWQIFEKIVFNHVSGQLKVAPEHFDKTVLKLMRKGASADFAAFARRFYQSCARAGRKLFLVPYLMSAFPGCGNNDALLAEKITELNLVHEQIQEFTPTPGSLATAMYYCETDFTGHRIAVRKNRNDRLATRRSIHQNKNQPHPKNSKNQQTPKKTTPPKKTKSPKSPKRK